MKNTYIIIKYISLKMTLLALSDERFLAAGGQAAFAMSHERFGR